MQHLSPLLLPIQLPLAHCTAKGDVTIPELLKASMELTHCAPSTRGQWCSAVLCPKRQGKPALAVKCRSQQPAGHEKLWPVNSFLVYAVGKTQLDGRRTWA